ncbi:MAG TPA: M20 family metallopeptidase [Streptosporangiaceae bacterium]|jgi:hippurate hydrolase
MSLRDDAAAIADDMVALRRDLHADPEVGLDLPRTQAKVLAALDGLPLEVTTGTALSSVTGVLRGGRPGPTVLLRGDMDALPVTEATGLPYASTNGNMHACGHDLHVAGLTGAARLLSARREELAGNVVFMFQPGEEGHGGAKIMIDEGVLDASGERAVAAYGLHVMSSIAPRGIFAGKPDATMSAASDLSVRVIGQGGHGSMPYTTRDPVPAICEMVTALQTFVTRTFDVFDPAIITVGNLHAGTLRNIIPGEAHFDATVRCFSPEAQAKLEAGTIRVVEGIAAAHGVEVDARFRALYPVTTNDPAEYAATEEAITDLAGPERYIRLPKPIPASEDFSFVLDEVPGAFVFLCACPPELDPATAGSNHAPDAQFDDSVLTDSATLLADLALRRLARG